MSVCPWLTKGPRSEPVCAKWLCRNGAPAAQSRGPQGPSRCRAARGVSVSFIVISSLGYKILRAFSLCRTRHHRILCGKTPDFSMSAVVGEIAQGLCRLSRRSDNYIPCLMVGNYTVRGTARENNDYDCLQRHTNASFPSPAGPAWPRVSMVTKQEAVPLVKALACNNNGQIDTVLPGWGRGRKGSATPEP